MFCHHILVIVAAPMCPLLGRVKASHLCIEPGFMIVGCDKSAGWNAVFLADTDVRCFPVCVVMYVGIVFFEIVLIVGVQAVL